MRTLKSKHSSLEVRRSQIMGLEEEDCSRATLSQHRHPQCLGTTQVQEDLEPRVEDLDLLPHLERIHSDKDQCRIHQRLPLRLLSQPQQDLPSQQALEIRDHQQVSQQLQYEVASSRQTSKEIASERQESNLLFTFIKVNCRSQ